MLERFFGDFRLGWLTSDWQGEEDSNEEDDKDGVVHDLDENPGITTVWTCGTFEVDSSLRVIVSIIRTFLEVNSFKSLVLSSVTPFFNFVHLLESITSIFTVFE